MKGEDGFMLGPVDMLGGVDGVCHPSPGVNNVFRTDRTQCYAQTIKGLNSQSNTYTLQKQKPKHRDLNKLSFLLILDFSGVFF